MLETLNERLHVSFEKVNTFLSQGDFVKTIFIDFIRSSLERGDFIDLLNRLSDILDIDMEEAQLIVTTLFKLDRLEQVENSVSHDSFIFVNCNIKLDTFFNTSHVRIFSVPLFLFTFMFIVCRSANWLKQGSGVTERACPLK